MGKYVHTYTYIHYPYMLRTKPIFMEMFIPIICVATKFVPHSIGIQYIGAYLTTNAQIHQQIFIKFLNKNVRQEPTTINNNYRRPYRQTDKQTDE